MELTKAEACAAFDRAYAKWERFYAPDESMIAVLIDEEINHAREGKALRHE